MPIMAEGNQKRVIAAKQELPLDFQVAFFENLDLNAFIDFQWLVKNYSSSAFLWPFFFGQK